MHAESGEERERWRVAIEAAIGRMREATERTSAERDALSRVPFQQRDGVKKAGAEYVDASRLLETIEQKRRDGPPKCFTVGCSVNYEYDLWRYDTKDDYVGEGLEKPAAILSPKGLTKADLEERAREFSGK